MRICLHTVFWVSNLGTLVHLSIIIAAGLIVYGGSSSFSELSLGVFTSQYYPWLSWIKAVLSTLLGGLGLWILGLPILVISPLKIIAGALIGFWAYSELRKPKP
ncbi:MAG: hypothetical protein AB8C46_26515 [Burkholderiaceae bacterium]